MKDFGESLIVLGIMGCIFFWFIYDPSVSVPSNPHFSGRVVNIHRSQTKTRGIMISIGAAVVGAILVASAKPEDNDESSESTLTKRKSMPETPKQQPHASRSAKTGSPSLTSIPQKKTRTQAAPISRITKPPPPPPRRKS